MRVRTIRWLGALVLPLAAASAAADPAPSVGSTWRQHFPEGSELAPIDALKPGEVAFSVRSKEGQRLGWVLRTDTIAPVVKGYKDQIGIVVALTAERVIIDVRVVTPNKETPKSFRRIRSGFYKQFAGHKLDTPFTDIDAVTKATKSSAAIIKDVERSCRTLLDRVGSVPPHAQGAPPAKDI